jgi:hypothetical protein
VNDDAEPQTNHAVVPDMRLLAALCGAGNMEDAHAKGRAELEAAAERGKMNCSSVSRVVV